MKTTLPGTNLLKSMQATINSYDFNILSKSFKTYICKLGKDL